MYCQRKGILHMIFLAAAYLVSFLPLWAGQRQTEGAEVAPGHVVINEVLASNSRSIYDGDFGTYSDWIELYNPTGKAVDLEGWYLSDDPADPGKWQIPGSAMIPADGYILFWADNRDLRPGELAWTEFTTPEQITVSEYHLNFRINSEQEEILLSDPQGVRVDSVMLRKQQRDYASGRNADGSWSYLGEPTPLAVNSLHYSDDFILSERPVFSLQGGLYPGSQQLELEGPGGGAVIRYTTDGSEPTGGSPEYTGPISLLFSQVVKARLIEEGKLPGEVWTESYIIQKETSLPVLSISTDHNNLWGFDFGLYQRNLKNREVFAHLEYFDENGNKAFRINAGLQLFGSQIFLFDQKPFSIFFRKRYGQDSLNYPLFRNREVDSYHSLVLRNGGNDNNLTMIRDGLGATLVENRMDLDYQSFQPVVVYMNGEYWGIFHLREKLNEEYLATSRGVNPDHVDILEDSLQVNMGDANQYRELIDFVSGKDLSIPENYQYVSGKIDLSEFINYMSFKIYGGYRQWQVNNKFWKERIPDSRWRWIAFDLEHCFAGPGGDSYETNTLYYALDPGSGPAVWHTLLFRKLMENEDFRATFLQRTALYLGTVFEEDRVIGVIDSLKVLIEDEMESHIARWNSPVSRASWLQHMADLEEFARLRNRQVMTHLMDYAPDQDTSTLTLQCGAGGKIALAGALVMDPGKESYTLLRGLPIGLEALPEPGFTFSGWNAADPDTHMDLVLSGDTLLVANFEPFSDDLLPDTISGTLILEEVSRAYLSAGSVFVPAGDTLILRAGVTIRMAPGASLLVEGCLQVEGRKERPVYMDVNPLAVGDYLSYRSRKWGGIIIRSADSLAIRHLHLNNASSGEGVGPYKGAISAVGSSLSMTGLFISGVKDPVWCMESLVRIDSSTLSSNGTGDLINLVNCHSPVIADNVLLGNYYEDTDAIDLDSVFGAVVTNNRIGSFFGSNSDGIDLGGHCREV
ncbi:MAG: CotH kinase family protein, partial [Bacteroidales bacterium]